MVEHMSAEAPKKIGIYYEADPEVADLLDKLKKMGIDKSKVLDYAVKRLTEMEFRDFLAEMWYPEAKKLAVLDVFKGAKQEVK